MANDGGEQVAVGLEHILVLGSLPHLGDDLAFNGNQVEGAAVALVSAQSQFPPGE